MQSSLSYYGLSFRVGVVVLAHLPYPGPSRLLYSTQHTNTYCGYHNLAAAQRQTSHHGQKYPHCGHISSLQVPLRTLLHHKLQMYNDTDWEHLWLGMLLAPNRSQQLHILGRGGMCFGVCGQLIRPFVSELLQSSLGQQLLPPLGVAHTRSRIANSTSRVAKPGCIYMKTYVLVCQLYISVDLYLYVDFEKSDLMRL